MAKCPELSINEMLSDPIVRAMMASDRVNLGELQHLLRSIAEHPSNACTMNSGALIFALGHVRTLALGHVRTAPWQKPF